MNFDAVRNRDAKPLLFSVDSLDVRVVTTRRPTLALLEAATGWRDAQSNWKDGDENPVELVTGVGTFTVLPGHRRYEFTLVNPEIGDIRIWKPENFENSMKSKTGPLYVSFRSKYLLYNGVGGAYRTLSRIVDHFLERSSDLVTFRVSRVDLAADIQLSSGLDYDDLRTLVTRAQLTEAWNCLPEDIAPRQSRHGSPMDNREPGKASKGKELEKGDKSPVSTVGESAPVNVWTPTMFTPVVGAGDTRPASADVSRIITRNREIETVYVGRFGSVQYCRIYDKKKACEVQEKPYYFDLWKQAGWDGKSPVWRVEFSIAGEALKEFKYTTQDPGYDAVVHDLHELKHLSRNIPMLWAYYAGGEFWDSYQTPKKKLERRKLVSFGWLRAVDPATATRLKRCTVLRWWEAVQNAVKRHEPARRTAPRPAPQRERILAGARGYVGSAVALIAGAVGDVGAALDQVLCDLLDWATREEGQERIRVKRTIYGTDDATESALWRRQRLAVGAGS